MTFLILKKINRLVMLAGAAMALPALAVEIQFPPETGAFKQAPGAELANGQCLVCHSVEYVSTQPPMPRTFWKSSVQKMQQKYGATIPDDQVELLVDYLTSNYGSGTNTASPTAAQPSVPAAKIDASQLAGKYGCLGCHNVSIKIVGPSYHEIAAKYKSDPKASEKIDEQIHKGGSGKWGPVIMPPFPQVTPAETRALSQWVLSQ